MYICIRRSSTFHSRDQTRIFKMMVNANLTKILTNIVVECCLLLHTTSKQE
jgi:hypothetical protein